MSIIEAIKNVLQNKEELLSHRVYAAKIFFITTTLIFFINYLFIGAGFLRNIAEPALSYTYTLFLVSYFLYITYSLLYYLRGKMRALAYGIIVCLALVFFIFLLPVLTGKEVLSNII